MASEPKPGRPALPPDERCLNVTLRLHGEAREALEELTRAWGLGKSATARVVLVEAARDLRKRKQRKGSKR